MPANREARPGDQTDLPFTLDASSPISPECLISPRLSRRNFTAEPATAIEPGIRSQITLVVIIC